MPYNKTQITELRKEEKKKLILENAAKIFAQKGYHQTTVMNITEAAKISVGTFYLYFKNKEDVFEKLYDEIELIINRVNDYAVKKQTEIPAERFSNVVAASVWTCEKFKELTKIMLIEAVGLNPRFEKKYADIMIKSCNKMEETLKHLKELKLIDVEDIKLAAIAHEGAFNYAITYFLRTEENTDLLKYAYPLAVHSLQALKMEFNPMEMKESIKKMFQDLDKEAIDFLQFF